MYWMLLLSAQGTEFSYALFERECCLIMILIPSPSAQAQISMIMHGQSLYSCPIKTVARRWKTQRDKYISRVIVVGGALNVLELRRQLDSVLAKLLNMLGKQLALHIEPTNRMCDCSEKIERI